MLRLEFTEALHILATAKQQLDYILIECLKYDGDRSFKVSKTERERSWPINVIAFIGNDDQVSFWRRIMPVVAKAAKCHWGSFNRIITRAGLVYGHQQQPNQSVHLAIRSSAGSKFGDSFARY